MGSTDNLGETRFCKINGIPDRFQIALNSNRPWNVAAGDPDEGVSDFQGVATHEFGHATGFWTHLSDVCPGTTGDATMCPGNFPGSAYWRTLLDHDAHTFTSAY